MSPKLGTASMAPADLDICIIGAGFGGIAAGVVLKEAGYDRLAILEKSSGVGGVWRTNTYPNVACDTPIDLYSFSFYPGSTWTTNFAPGSEIRSYLGDLASSSGLSDLIEFDAEVASAVWDERRSMWSLTATDGRRWNSRFVVWAGGLFSQPIVPNTPGLDRYEGTQVHSAEWSESVDLEGKRVALVGGGATAIQILPYAAEQAAHVVNFVRTPSYVSPRPDLIFDHDRLDPETFVTQQRERREAWFERFEVIARSRFPMNHSLISEQEAAWREYFDSVITDPTLRKALTPNYRFGCKRPLFSNAYYPAIRRENVTVVSSEVAALTKDSIVDQDGNEHAVDMIVWATGFDPAAMLGNLRITGRNGRELGAFWGSAPEAYYGTYVKGFPNLFIINGPNVGGAAASVFIEAQLRFVADSLAKLDELGGRIVEVTPEAHDAFNADIQARADKSVMVLGNCNSYYRAGGTGKVFTHWPGTIAAFTHQVAERALDGLSFDHPRTPERTHSTDRTEQQDPSAAQSRATPQRKDMAKK